MIDQKSAFVAEGLDEEAAIDKAIEEMGDPVLVGYFTINRISIESTCFIWYWYAVNFDQRCSGGGTWHRQHGACLFT